MKTSLEECIEVSEDHFKKFLKWRCEIWPKRKIAEFYPRALQ